MMVILAFIALLALLILAHELGHFLAAKASGVKVEEFGLGFPPRLVAFQWGETRYSLNLLPLGGFVRLAGEEDPLEPRSLASKSIGTRLFILAAGSTMNILLPIALFSGSLMLPHQVERGEVSVIEVAPGSPAQRAGIQPGDIILQLNDRAVENFSDLHYFIQLHLGKEVTLRINRAGSGEKLIRVTPRWNPPPGEGAIGIKVTLLNPSTVTRSYPFWEAIPQGARNSVETFILFRNEILSWFIRGTAPQVVGPVGIVQVAGEVAKAGTSPLLDFAAFLSINLAIINLLPLPALDGGRIVFVLLEWVRRGKRVPPHQERLIHLIGFALLIMLIVMVSYNDILRIVQGEGLIP
jgi:regulator of sigma E protease